MNYQESQLIKQKINSSKKILVNMHHNPDADSVGSAIAMAKVIKSFDPPSQSFGGASKEVKVLTLTEVPKNLRFLIHDEDVEIVDYHNFDFSGYDLFITLDSSSWGRVSGANDVDKPNINLINIDHHDTNQKFGEINLVVPAASANCEILYLLFQDWGIDLKIFAEPLLTGIIGDTGAFRFPEANEKTFLCATELMKYADKNKIIFNLYQSFEENHVYVWGELLKNLKVDHENKFVYSFIKKDILQRYGKPFNAKSELADMLFQSIEGTDFGVVGAEDDGYISVSFRSRTGIDVSKLAQILGGGGHVWASAARVYGVDYNQNVEKILEKAREFSKKNRSGNK